MVESAFLGTVNNRYEFGKLQGECGSENQHTISREKGVFKPPMAMPPLYFHLLSPKILSNHGLLYRHFVIVMCGRI